jgi:hypothetical protein
LFVGFFVAVAAAFAALLPFAYSVARDIRRCRDQFPHDLARFEQLLHSGDFYAIYSGSSAALQRSVSLEAFRSNKDELVPDRARHLISLGDYSAFGWQCTWVDDGGEPVTALRFQFWWEDGQHKLHRVPGLLEPRRDRVIR